MFKILVVDDEANIREMLMLMLKGGDCQVTSAASAQAALQLVEHDAYDLVITDWKMASMSGLELLKHLKPAHPRLDIILMTAFGSIESAVEAMRLGASDYVTKPFRQDDLLTRVWNLLNKKAPQSPSAPSHRHIQSQLGLEYIIGESHELTRVVEKVKQVAPSDSTVLITGETGTGKELVAKAVHGLSRRAHRPFVSVNCAAFPEHLLESELFGHAKGAYTGATADRKGLIEEAHGGTLFLDEVGAAPLSVQAKLLRVLEDRTIRRIGENQLMTVDIRVVAATNQDLSAAIIRREFREDLYYRLNVVSIHIPPLRARRSDIPLLAEYFLGQFRERENKEIHGISSDAMRLLLAYDYPGNVRELKHVMEQAVTMSQETLIPVEAIPQHIREAVWEKINLAETLPKLALLDGDKPRLKALELREQALIQDAVERNRGNLDQAARELGISRVTLWRRMKKFNIK